MRPISRRDFLAAVTAAPALVGLSCKSGPVITGGFVDDDSSVGHALRDGTITTRAREQRRVAVAIVGGGIGGLSAGWRLDAVGMRDWLLLEWGRLTPAAEYAYCVRPLQSRPTPGAVPPHTYGTPS